MSNQKKKPLFVLVPLLVLVFLTFLVGWTSYQQAFQLEDAVERSVNRISRLMILNDIQWRLKTYILRSQNDKTTIPHSETQPEHLKTVKEELILLNSLPTTAYQPALSFPRPGSFDQLSQEELQQLANQKLTSLNHTLQELKDLHSQTAQVNRMVTGSMVILGGILALFTVMETERLFRHLRGSRQLTLQLQEKERCRIAQELHDGTLQELISLKRNPDTAKINDLIDQVRRICHNLKPHILDDLGLASAIEFLADDLRQTGITSVHLNLDSTTLSQIPANIELPLFRIIQELCSNIKKHANATHVQMMITFEPRESPMLSGLVTDNGNGFDMKAINKASSMGLSGIQDRLQQLGGKLTVNSVPGKGSQFQFIIPVPVTPA